MLQIKEQDRDMLMNLIVEGCYSNIKHGTVNLILKSLKELKPVEKKKQKN